MNAYDELLNLHGPLTSDAQKQPEYRDNTETATYGYSEGVEHALETVWAKGYRKPRTITTVEELDALGFHAVVIDPCGDPAICVSSGLNSCSWTFGGAGQVIDSTTLLLSGTSCTVLHDGGAS